MTDNLILDLGKTKAEMDLQIETTHKSLDIELKTSQGTTDYELLRNKPRIETVELVGDKTLKQIGVDTLSVQDIEKILYLD